MNIKLYLEADREHEYTGRGEGGFLAGTTCTLNVFLFGDGYIRRWFSPATSMYMSFRVAFLLILWHLQVWRLWGEKEILDGRNWRDEEYNKTEFKCGTFSLGTIMHIWQIESWQPMRGMDITSIGPANGWLVGYLVSHGVNYGLVY